MNSKQVLTVIKNLQRVIPAGKGLDMNKCDVHLCGTTHCHGGWYAVATMPFFRLLFPFGIWLLNIKEIDFLDGAERMSKDLGFEEERELSNWAKENPLIWGNEDGDRMFGHKKAFYHPTKRPDGAESIADIVDHWYDVYDRLKAEEEKAKIVVVEKIRYVAVDSDIRVKSIEIMAEVSQ